MLIARFSGAAAAFALSVAIAVACSGSGGHGGPPPAEAGGDDGATDAPLGGDDGGADSNLVGDGGGNPCPTHCSADLHQILDCNDKLVQTCPSDKGCGPNNTCIDPCAAAEDSQTTIGCDFYALTTAPMSQTRGSCYAALLANTWTSPVTLAVEYNGTKLPTAGFARVPQGSGTLTYQPLANGQLAPGQIGILFLSAKDSGDEFWTACPAGVTPAVTADFTDVDGTALGHAFHITTSAPVVAYDIFPYGGATSYVTSASLLVPTPAWGTNYIAVDGYAADPYLSMSFDGHPYIQIVAAADQTHVTISPTADIAPGTGVAGTGKGKPATYTLASGQFVQFMQDPELAGSPIQSDKPVSVWGGSSCADVPVSSGACDSLHQQLVPVSTLGRTYTAVRYRNRGMAEETVPWRFVGAVDGTTLTFDPPQMGAPATLASGQLVEYTAPGPFSVTSQDDKHPFYLGAHMTGSTEEPTTNSDGDPDFVNIVPPDQWLPSYLFLTDPTYADTNLVFVRAKPKNGAFADVTLDCAGKLAGWQAIGGGGTYEYTRVDLVIAGAPQGKCNNGVHTATSTAPFALTVWGWDHSVSYAYPAGMSTLPINMVVVPPVPK
jgi:hypothetical protein